MGLLGGKSFGKGEPEIEELPVARRRPLDGSESKRPQAFSYYAQRSSSGANEPRRSDGSPRAIRGPLDPSQAPLRPSYDMAGIGKAWRQNRIAATMAFIVILGLLGGLTYLSTDPKIVTVNKGGNAYFLQDTGIYRNVAARELSGSMLNKNKLSVNKSGLSRELGARFPEIAAATLQVPLIGTQPVVRIVPTRPTFILTTADNGAYLLDQDGHALVSTSQIQDPGELAVPTMQDQTGAMVKLGEQVLPSTTIAFAEQVLGYLKAAGVSYGSVTLPQTAGELDVAIKDTPYIVKFNLTGEARLQAGTYLAAKGRLDKDRVVPKQYIDVRVPERAYYL